MKAQEQKLTLNAPATFFKPDAWSVSCSFSVVMAFNVGCLSAQESWY
jgi:hypothetical protein